MISFSLSERQSKLSRFAQFSSKRIVLPACAVLLSFSSAVYAQSSTQPASSKPSPIQQMAQLNATGNPLQAYQIGMQLLPQLEGEPAFDLHYGVAAIDSGYASQGAFALERVLMNQPKNDYARLELGRAYFILEEDDRAKAEFQKVLDANPPKDVADNVKPYLRAIDSRAAWRETTYTANIEIGGGYDSNILASPDDIDYSIIGGVLIPDINGPVNIGSPSESDSFFQINAAASVSHPIRYGTNIFLSGNMSKRDNDSNQLNISSYGIQTGVVYRKGAHNVRAALQGDILNLDSDKYRDSAGVNLSWQYSLSARASASLSGQLIKQNYNKNYVDRDGRANNLDFRDSTVSRLGIGYRYQFIAPLRPVASLSLSLGKDNVDDENASGALENAQRDVIAASGSLVLSIKPDLQLTGSISYENSEYAAPDNVIPLITLSPGTGVIRDDDQYRGSLALAWSPKDNLIIKLDGSMSAKRSNIPFLEYDRDQITLSVRYMYR